MDGANLAKRLPMSKIQTVRRLNDSAQQLAAVKSTRELQQTIEKMQPHLQMQQSLDALASQLEPLAQALASLTDESRAEIQRAGQAAMKAAKLQDQAAAKLVKATKGLQATFLQLQESSREMAKAKRPSFWIPVLCSSLLTAVATSVFLILAGGL